MGFDLGGWWALGPFRGAGVSYFRWDNLVFVTQFFVCHKWEAGSDEGGDSKDFFDGGGLGYF